MSQKEGCSPIWYDLFETSRQGESEGNKDLEVEGTAQTSAHTTPPQLVHRGN